jgi:N-acetyl-gamma-glutamyl-phosphate reductase
VIAAAIVGASGYSGVELMRILSRHPDVSITTATAGKSAGERVEKLYPDLAGRVELELEPLLPERLQGADVAFLALPSGESMAVAPKIRGNVGCIIDLSGDFRLASAELYEQFYGQQHAAPDLLQLAVYGLPELNREAIASAGFLSNPGCYPTSAILALLPVLRHDMIDPSTIVINSLSGVSGAGRSSKVEMSFTEVNENVRAYKVGVHQHIPEIQTVLESATGRDVSLTFVPHLIPISRGIYTTVTARMSRSLSRGDLLALYQAHYHGEPFVRIKEGIPEITHVHHTNFCDIGLVVEERTQRIIILSVLDNMMKGAAGQAVQNMNIMLGFPEERSLV